MSGCETRKPLWAAAAKAYAEGRIGPPPRMPQVRPESDYEMNLEEAALFADVMDRVLEGLRQR